MGSRIAPGVVLWGIISLLSLVPFLIAGAAGLFGFIRQDNGKTTQTHTNRRRIIVALAAIILFGLSASISVIVQQDQEFNATEWQNTSRIARTPRQKMVEDLTINILPNMTKDEVEDLLGEPDETAQFANTEFDLIYFLADDPGPFGYQTEWLLIWFDESGMFKRYAIYTSD